MTGPPTTRRGALALLGSSLLAGCSGLGIQSGNDGPELGASALREVTEGSLPSLPRTLPVEISPAFLGDRESWPRIALDGVPAPLDSEDVPNGAIRERMSRERASARDALDRADAAESELQRLDALGDAREHAANLLGAWEAIENGLTRNAVVREAASVRDDLSAFADRWTYLGADPVRSALVHGELESRVRRADRFLSSELERGRRRYDPENPLAVGEAAATIEAARTNVAAADHIYDRFVDSLADPTNLRRRFAGAGETLAGRLREASADLPAESEETKAIVGRSIEGTPAESALDGLRWRAANARGRESGGDDPATELLDMHSLLAAVEAFRTLRDRVTEGDSFTVSSVEDVETRREAAVDAVNAARTDDDYPRLTRAELPTVVGRLSRADDDIASREGTVRAGWIRREISTYVTQRHVAEAIPRASRTVGDALSGG
ncbi:hypothetical protein SAMN04488063_3265 [Halopelagius inordinatus]|uniref:Uncharacterized protein n=1 Tax=Halopelagius inordinatus TaxID=553467 RepID=A0A1I2VPM7_9EURY|nr:hypothetical protein [Halopelagius inordinatus]SFG91264.1 hypothetical protein SAMN04488063_3265 [Halopelagius inordinatus]